LRDHRTKLITANEGNKRDYAPRELYDLTVDPNEQVNLADERSAQVTLFEKGLEDMGQYIEGGAVEPSGFEASELPPELRGELEALGYLRGDDDSD